MNVINMLTGSGQGLQPQVLVTAPTGSTVTLDGIEGTEVSGVWTFNTTIGTHTVYASKNGISKTVEVLVDTIAQYSVEITYSRVPSEYQELSYIESTGTQYIDTGFTANQDSKVEIDFQYTVINGGRLFGARTSQSSRVFALGTWTSKEWAFGYNNNYYPYSTSNTNRHIMTLDKNNGYLDGNLVYSRSYAQFTCERTCFLFSLNAVDGIGQMPSVKVYNCNVYDNSTIVRNFIPCYRKSDGEVGLYDTVTESFFTNQGTGSFKMGAVLDDDFQSEYQQVEYLQSTNKERIDTGVIATKSIIDFSMTEVTVQRICQGKNNDYALCGYHTNSIIGWYMAWNTYIRSGSLDAVANTRYLANSICKSGTQTLTVNGVQKISNASTTSITRVETTLFNYYTDGDGEGSRIKMYSALLYDDSNVLLRLFIPCYRITDSVAGLYDLVNKVFYTNQGTGTFTVGGDID